MCIRDSHDALGLDAIVKGLHAGVDDDLYDGDKRSCQQDVKRRRAEQRQHQEEY